MIQSSILKAVAGAAFLLTSAANALTPDGGKWHQPGSPFTVRNQIPTRYVGKGGTKLQSDPYGMPSYGELREGPYDDGYTSVMDFGRPSYHHQEAARRRSEGVAPPEQEASDMFCEFERQQYFRIEEDYTRPGKERMNHYQLAGGEEDYFFSGHPNFPGPGPEGIPSFFHQAPPTEFSFTGRPSTSFHQRALRPDFY
jgi:hypothetical protein